MIGSVLLELISAEIFSHIDLKKMPHFEDPNHGHEHID